MWRHDALCKISIAPEPQLNTGYMAMDSSSPPSKV
ncbi:uncharacterized protein CLUP02_13668 [Colletotrichum lupini]|uniref:Uncharacterized protein n=1 Tax=Colletotrichum lupini TaxID=145971 RepID=A0A9Q8WMJ4_9PEZI|nr:uncharacterized protein CLUP02_13668 [Colletotrichum lupini]UQC88145.1 hypothetical protein CLUP02_13668 [Colletotrichum lupini]